METLPFQPPNPVPVPIPMPMPLPSEFPRGVSPEILFRHIRNTADFLFEEGFKAGQNSRFLKVLGDAQNRLSKFPSLELSHSDYFELCTSAHWGTVASFVPTDVDNQIRFRLWHPTLPLETLFSMVDLVIEATDWDCRSVSTRWVRSPDSGDVLSGHNGEWFSIAAAAYGALRKRHPERANGIRLRILDELAREARVFNQFRKTKNGIGALKAATVIAHNLGDLVRVMDMWNLPEDDVLRKNVEDSVTPAFESGAFVTSNQLNKQYMANENHRHFALRKPKALRKSVELLIPLGPFFDDWGSTLAKHPLLTHEELGEITEALVDGWNYLENAVGYSRALAGIESSLKGGLTQLCRLVPSRIAKQLSTGKLRTQIAVSKDRFESQWNQFGLKNF